MKNENTYTVIARAKRSHELANNPHQQADCFAFGSQ
jgi:hypothetical protein